MKKTSTWYLKPLFLSLVVSVLVILVVLPMIFQMGANYYIEPRLEEIKADRGAYYTLMLEDLEYLKKYPIFSNFTYNNNAQHLLEKYVPFEGAAKQIADPEWVSQIEKLRDKYGTKWMSQPEVFANLLNEPEVKGFDTDTWMDQLLEYDHWEISEYPEINEQIKKASSSNSLEKIGIWSSLPIPQYSVLSLLASIHVAKSKDKNAAIKVYRHIAKLMHSSHSLIGNMMAVQHLKNEASLVSQFHIKNWEPIKGDLIEKYKRVSWGWGDVIGQTYLFNFDKRFEPYLKSELGLCAHVQERVADIGGLSDFLEGGWPLEINYKKGMEQGRVFLGQLMDTCHMQEWKVFNQPTLPGENPLFTSKDDQQAFDDFFGFSFFVNSSRVPYIRGSIGAILATIGTPRFNNLYRKLASEESKETLEN